MNSYLVWDEDESREDARKIEEMYPECAATRWAEKDDNESAEYDIANGDKVVVCVEDVATGEVQRFGVSGECTPIYYANKVNNAPASE